MLSFLLPIIYLSFISLGLPDSLLGSAWPSIYPELNVPVSFAGIVSMIIAAGTIISSLQSELLTLRFGTGRVTAVSVALTACALIGFSLSKSFPLLCLWAVPYGLGAGSVDASLNNYVALHYKSRHMSWLHCMWGVGASLGPVVMGSFLTGGHTWNDGYRLIGILQIALTLILFLSLPLWKKGAAADPGPDSGNSVSSDTELNRQPLSLQEIIRIPGAKAIMLSFFCYSTIEQTTGLWVSSYFVLHDHIPAQTAAGYAGLFFIGITVGRALSGFLTLVLNDRQMIRLGQAGILIGIILLLLPFGITYSFAGLILIGLGCAPIYPCIIHSTPAHFGADRSQAVIGVQMASAYVGTCIMPPLFGLIAEYISAA
ncbi:MAG: MFS transporter, partial [Eubacteriales bacterium]|nr:MFS transporter [Eubacteriales bacterium]